MRTFGALYIAGDSGELLTGAAAQRRTLTLLSVLAVAGSGGMSRDKVTALLWPEFDGDRARHSLTQTMYAARRALGCDDLFLADSDVRLNPDRIGSDVQEFEVAVASGHLEGGIDLYQGALLDGFQYPGSVELEHWLLGRRARLENMAVDALERLATDAEQLGDFARAVEWRRRLTALRPLDSGSAVKLMHALAAVGDRAGALTHARIHEMLLREQLDLEPDAVVTALVEKLRDPVVWASDAGTLSPVAAGTVRGDVEAIDETMTAVAEPIVAKRPAHFARGSVATEPATSLGVWVPARQMRTRRWRAAAVGVVALGLVGLGAVIALARRPSQEIGALPIPQKVVVAPFRSTGAAASLQYLREGMVELLSTRLADDSAARSVDPGAVLGAWRTAGLTRAADVPRDTIVQLAHKLGASRVVIGNVVGSATRVVLSAIVVGVPGGVVTGTADIEGPADSITTLVDRLAARLLVSEAGEDERLANQTTSSLGALRAYLEGQAAFRKNDFTAARRAFDRALQVDSSFALAAVSLALASDRLKLDAETARALALAWPFRDALTERDHARLLGFTGPRYPAPSSVREQLVAWERSSTLAPNRAEAWYELGARLAYDGMAIGLDDSADRAASALQRAVALDPSFTPARELLLHLTAAGRMNATDGELPSGAMVPDSLGTFADFIGWRVAAARGDTAGLRRVRDSLASFGRANIRAMAMAAQFDGADLDLAPRMVRLLLDRGSDRATRIDAALAEHSLALNEGRPRAALDATFHVRQADPGGHAHLRLRVLDALYAEGDSGAAASGAQQLTRLTDGVVPAAADASAQQLADLCVVGQWRLARGDTAGVPAIVSLLGGATTVRVPVPVGASPVVCGQLLDASLAVATRRRDALDRVAQLDSLALTGAVAGDASLYAPIVVARLFERLGDRLRALRAIQKRTYMSGWPRYLATALHEEGRLAESARDRAAARRAYERFVAFRSAPEDPLEPAVARVRARLGELESSAKR